MAEVEEMDSLPPAGLTELESQVIDFFVDGVRVLGLPGSVGEIYGLLFVSREPQSLDDLVVRLQISKGSASQGLRTLRTLGAVREDQVPGTRRAHYSAAVDLKRLGGGFIREQVRPHLDSGQLKIGRLFETVAAEEDREARVFFDERIGRLDGWMKRARMMLPLVQKVLGQ